jgi:hypothetical protein
MRHDTCRMRHHRFRNHIRLFFRHGIRLGIRNRLSVFSQQLRRFRRLWQFKLRRRINSQLQFHHSKQLQHHFVAQLSIN